MCDPVSALVAGVSAAGSIVSGMSKASTAKSNAAALESSAEQRLEKAKFDEDAAERRYRRQEGAVQALIGKTGVDAESFADVLADDHAESLLERKAIRYNAEVDANNLRFQASGQRVAAKNAMIEAAFGVATAVAGGVGRSQQIGAIGYKAGTFGGVSIHNEFTRPGPTLQGIY